MHNSIFKRVQVIVLIIATPLTFKYQWIRRQSIGQVIFFYFLFLALSTFFYFRHLFVFFKIDSSITWDSAPLNNYVSLMNSTALPTNDYRQPEVWYIDNYNAFQPYVSGKPFQFEYLQMKKEV